MAYDRDTILGMIGSRPSKFSRPLNTGQSDTPGNTSPFTSIGSESSMGNNYGPGGVLGSLSPNRAEDRIVQKRSGPSREEEERRWARTLFNERNNPAQEDKRRYDQKMGLLRGLL